MPVTEYTKLYRLHHKRCFRDVIAVLKHISVKTETNLKFPTMRVLKAISKKLLINVNEGLHLAHVLQADWPHQDPFFFEHSQEVRDVIFYRRPEEGYSPILVYLILQTAAIKFTLNDNFRIYSAELERTLPNFKEVFGIFLEKFPFDLGSPKEINTLYKQVLIQKQFVDYENLVDNIMHLCPTYRIGEDVDDGRHDSDSIKPVRTISVMPAPRKEAKPEVIDRFQLQSQYSEIEILRLHGKKAKHTNDFFCLQSESYLLFEGI